MAMKDAGKVKTPELDKMRGVKGDSQKLGEFIDWMSENGLSIAETHEHKGSADEVGGCYFEHRCGALCDRRCREEISLDCGYRTGEMYHTRLTIEKLLAKYFGIDLKKAEEERRAILDAINE